MCNTMYIRLLLLWTIYLTRSGSAEGYRILLIPTPFQSHLNYFIPFGEGLVEGGHEAHIVLSSGSKNIDDIKKKGLKVLLYHPADGICQLATDSFHRNVSDAMLANPDIHNLAAIVAPAVAKECDNFLTDDSVLQEATALDFDLAIVDGLFFARCLYLFPRRLGIPYITMTTFQEMWHAKIPAMPSHVPFHYSDFSERMTFIERVKNTLINIMWLLSSRTCPPLSAGIRESYSAILARDNFDELILQSKLWFFNTDIAVDYPKPTMPNVVYIGGMSPKPPNPLDEDLQTFMDSSAEGVIIVSFGSIIYDVPLELNQKLVSAFRRLPWNVLWRNKDTRGLDIPSNVKVMKWLPQNDLLGHKNTLAFVTHCGNNGQFEALYHEVPMVGFPIFADQPYNARRMVERGYGVAIDVRTFTSDQLVEAIETVATNITYRTSLEKGAAIFKNRKQTAKERAVFWVEHVIEHGGDHLRSYAMDMPWYQYLLIDVFAFIGTLLITIIAVTLVLLKALGHFLINVMMEHKKTKTL